MPEALLPLVLDYAEEAETIDIDFYLDESEKAAIQRYLALFETLDAQVPAVLISQSPLHLGRVPCTSEIEQIDFISKLLQQNKALQKENAELKKENRGLTKELAENLSEGERQDLERTLRSHGFF